MLRIPLVETTAFSYQLIAERAIALRRIGLSDSSIARSLGVTDKTVAKAIRWLSIRYIPVRDHRNR